MDTLKNLLRNLVGSIRSFITGGWMTAYAPGWQGDQPPGQNNGPSRDLRLVFNTLWWAILFGVAGIFIYSWTHLAEWGRLGAPFLWALACLAAGAGVGFLFGIPKTAQAGAAPAPPPEGGQAAPGSAAHLEVNTNLEQISDWLTKIIVGVSLVQVNKVPDALHELAATLAGAMDGPDQAGRSVGFALALIVYFAIIGFFFGYLMTRLFLTRAFRDVEDQRAQAIVNRLDQIHETLAEKLPAATVEEAPPKTEASEPKPVPPGKPGTS